MKQIYAYVSSRIHYTRLSASDSQQVDSAFHTESLVGRFFNQCRYLQPGKLRQMKRTNDHDERIAKMTFASVYPHYLAKVERKGRTKEELHQVISWLTGFNVKALQKLIKDSVTFEQLFQNARLNPNAHLVTGVICGYRIEEIENPLTQRVRCLDKLVDELAKGRNMEKILRSE